MPGTGKTFTIVQLVRILVAMGNSVLLSSFTNSAVDNILIKLMEEKVDFMRVGSRQRVHPSVVQYTAQEFTKRVETAEDLKVLYESKVSKEMAMEESLLQLLYYF